MALISEKGKFNRESPTITETYQITATTAIATARTFLGGSSLVSGVIVYLPPAVHSSGLVCLSADYDIDYQADGGGNIATLTVEYGIPDYDATEDDDDEETVDVGSVSVSLGGDMLTLEKGKYEWTEGSNSGETLGDDDAKPYKVIPAATVQVKFNSKPSLNLSAIAAKYGKLNSAAFNLPGIPGSIDTEFCRFEGIDASRKFSNDGGQFWEVTYAFAVGSHSFNKLWDGEKYSGVQTEGGDDIYETTSFSGIFSI